MKLIERLILETATEEDLNLNEFIDSVRSDPDDWYAFRRHELIRFVEGILSEVSQLTDSSSVPTGVSLEQLRLHFGLADALSLPEEQPIDWHEFTKNT